MIFFLNYITNISDHKLRDVLKLIFTISNGQADVERGV